MENYDIPIQDTYVSWREMKLLIRNITFPSHPMLF